MRQHRATLVLAVLGAVLLFSPSAAAAPFCSPEALLPLDNNWGERRGTLHVSSMPALDYGETLCFDASGNRDKSYVIQYACRSNGVNQVQLLGLRSSFDDDKLCDHRGEGSYAVDDFSYDQSFEVALSAEDCAAWSKYRDDKLTAIYDQVVKKDRLAAANASALEAWKDVRAELRKARGEGDSLRTLDAVARSAEGAADRLLDLFGRIPMPASPKVKVLSEGYPLAKCALKNVLAGDARAKNDEAAKCYAAHVAGKHWGAGLAASTVLVSDALVELRKSQDGYDKILDSLDKKLHKVEDQISNFERAVESGRYAARVLKDINAAKNQIDGLCNETRPTAG